MDSRVVGVDEDEVKRTGFDQGNGTKRKKISSEAASARESSVDGWFDVLNTLGWIGGLSSTLRKTITKSNVRFLTKTCEKT